MFPNACIAILIFNQDNQKKNCYVYSYERLEKLS